MNKQFGNGNLLRWYAIAITLALLLSVAYHFGSMQGRTRDASASGNDTLTSSSPAAVAATGTPAPTPTIARGDQHEFPLKHLPRQLGGLNLDIDSAGVGTIGAAHIHAAAVPLDGGGSGGATSFAVYGIKSGVPTLLQVSKNMPSDHLGDVAIHDGRISFTVSKYAPHDAHCCPSAETRYTYAWRGHMVKTSSSDIAVAKPTGEPAAQPLQFTPASSADPAYSAKAGASAAQVAPPGAAPAAPVSRAFSGGAGGESCDDDSIETVSEDGEILIMTSGEKFHVDGGDEATTSTWVAADDVVICNGDTIINKDENGEKVDVSKL